MTYIRIGAYEKIWDDSSTFNNIYSQSAFYENEKAEHNSGSKTMTLVYR